MEKYDFPLNIGKDLVVEQFIGGIEIYLKASIVLSFCAAFASGLLTSFTPCIYPMIPITAGFVSSGNLNGSKFRGFFLSLFYVVGMAVTYACLGVFAALTGSLFGGVSSNPWTHLFVANVMILFGLGMLDVFNFPTLGKDFSVEGHGLPGAFIMGLASGFIAAPCSAPMVGALLAYVASTQNAVYGGSLLFIFALGMGALLLLIGTFSGIVASLPKSGVWMVRIKKGLGLGMIGIGEYFLIKMGQLIF